MRRALVIALAALALGGCGIRQVPAYRGTTTHPGKVHEQ